MNLVSDLPLSRKVTLGAAVVLFVDGFLPWYHVSLGGLSASASGWHQLGVFVQLLTIVLIAWEAARIFGLLPVPPRTVSLISTIIAGLVVLFLLIFVIKRFADGEVGFGVYIGLICLIALAYGTFLLFQEGGGAAPFKDLQASVQAQAQAHSHAAHAAPAAAAPVVAEAAPTVVDAEPVVETDAASAAKDATTE